MAKMAGALSQPGTLVRLSEMSDRNRTCQSVRVTPHPDVQPGPTTLKTPFSGRGDMPLSGLIVNKFRMPAVLQLNVEGLTASRMNVLHHLTVQYEALVILLQETHSTCADKLIHTYIHFNFFKITGPISIKLGTIDHYPEINVIRG